jgi:hypothetical protein
LVPPEIVVEPTVRKLARVAVPPNATVVPFNTIVLLARDELAIGVNPTPKDPEVNAPTPVMPE